MGENPPSFEGGAGGGSHRVVRYPGTQKRQSRSGKRGKKRMFSPLRNVAGSSFKTRGRKIMPTERRILEELSGRGENKKGK